jgi:ribosomal protein L37AE/L43A
VGAATNHRVKLETPETVTCPSCGGHGAIGLSDGYAVGYWKCRECANTWEAVGFAAAAARATIDGFRRGDAHPDTRAGSLGFQITHVYPREVEPRMICPEYF